MVKECKCCPTDRGNWIITWKLLSTRPWASWIRCRARWVSTLSLPPREMKSSFSPHDVFTVAVTFLSALRSRRGIVRWSSPSLRGGRYPDNIECVVLEAFGDFVRSALTRSELSHRCYTWTFSGTSSFHDINLTKCLTTEGAGNSNHQYSLNCREKKEKK